MEGDILILKYEADCGFYSDFGGSSDSLDSCDFCDDFSSSESGKENRSSNENVNISATSVLPLSHGRQPEIEKFYFGRSTQRRCVDYSHFRPGDQYAYRYELKKRVGGGSFGTVAKAFDHRDKKTVALKLMNQFQDDWKVYWAQKEATIMGHLKQMKDNAENANAKVTYVIQSMDCSQEIGIAFLLDRIDFHGFTCLSMELLGSNFDDAISDNDYAGFPTSQVRKIVPSLLRGLEFMHQHGYIHMDLKMVNVVLTNDDDWSQGAKLIDFNLTCKLEEIDGRRCAQITAATGKRFQKSQSEDAKQFADLSWGLVPLPHAPPEALLCSRGMSEKMDIWALGTILAELHRGRAIFSGSSSTSCLVSIIAELGELPTVLTANTDLCMLTHRGIGPKQLLARRFAGASKPNGKPTKFGVAKSEPLFKDFLEKMINLDAGARWSASALLTHKWLGTDNS